MTELKPGTAMIHLDLDQQEASLVKMTSTGLVKAVKTYVRVNPSKGETYTLPKWTLDEQSNQWVKEEQIILTAMGYHRLNQFAGVSLNGPDTLLDDDGNVKPNPYSHRVNGEVQYVKVRRFGIGRNAIGNWIAMDLTVTYDLELYFAQDIWAKWRGKTNAAAPADWGKVYSTENIPSEILTDGSKKVVHCPGGVSLAVDLTSMQVLSLFNDRVKRQKFCERNAITICDRNILKKILGAQYVGEDLRVQVVSWQQADLDREAIEEMLVRLREGKLNIAGEIVDVEAEHIDVSEKDEVDAALHGEVDEEMARDADGADSSAPPVSVSESSSGGGSRRAEAIALMREVWGLVIDELRDEALASLANDNYRTPQQIAEDDSVGLKSIEDTTRYLTAFVSDADRSRFEAAFGSQ